MIEMLVAMVTSAVLIAGLGSVMYIARQVAYTPLAAARRAKTADIVNQISDELRYATVITQQSARVLEFVVADRNNDGTSEKIRYEWSGTAGAPLRKSVNGATAADVLPAVYSFVVAPQQKSVTTTLTTTADSTESLLLASPTVTSGSYRDIDTSNFISTTIVPTSANGLPVNALSWNLTKIEFHGKQYGAASDTLTVQLRHSGDPYDSPTGDVIGQATIAESSILSSAGFNTVTFTNSVRNLALNRNYQLTFLQQSGSGKAAQITNYDSTSGTALFETNDAGASWQYVTPRRIYCKVYGTFTTPGSSYNVVRTYVPCIRLMLQAGNQSHARIDASIPLSNLPELLSGYWRTDFDRDPTTTNANGDTISDWAMSDGSPFDTSKLLNGVWTAAGALQTRPLSDFTTTTTVEARCRNTSVGGNGTTIAIYADRQNGKYGPVLVNIQKQANGTQTLSLKGKSSDAATKQLFSRTGLPSDFVRIRITIAPANSLVNLQINDEDQGTFTYPRYAPSSTTDRYLSISSDTSSSEFDYIEVRSGTN